MKSGFILDSLGSREHSRSASNVFLVSVNRNRNAQRCKQRERKGMRMEPHTIHRSSTDDPYPGIWLCAFPRLFFVNDDTGASYITQVGDVGGTFDAGGSIAAGQYTVSLVARCSMSSRDHLRESRIASQVIHSCRHASWPSRRNVSLFVSPMRSM
jgi:hypothetical protein